MHYVAKLAVEGFLSHEFFGKQECLRLSTIVFKGLAIMKQCDFASTRQNDVAKI